MAMATGSPSESRTSKLLSFLGGIGKALLSLGKSIPSDGSHCVECKQELGGDLKGYQFCSQACAADYWEKVRLKHNSTSTKEAVCKLPGCTKSCYIEPDGRVHDFCGRGHAKEYQELTGEIEKEKVRLWRVKLLSKSSSGEGTSYAVAAAGGGSSCTRSGTVYGPSSVSSHQRQFTDSHWRDNDTGPIHFYDRDALYYEFTNFYPASIHLDDKDWPTTEHYFQAQKFVGTPFVEMIRRCTFPREAFDLSRNPTVSRWRRKDWDEVKINVMRKALLAKFTQHDKLRRLLLSTRRRHLIEHTRNDSFWGDGGDGSGQNHLGRLLMEIRDVLLRNVVEKMPFSERESLQKGSSTSRKDQSSFRSSSLDSEFGQSSAGQRDSASSSPSGHAVVHTMSNNLQRRPLHENQHSGLPSTPGHNVPVGVLVDLSDSRPPTGKHSLVVGITPTGSPALRPGQMIVFSDSSISGALFSPNDIH